MKVKETSSIDFVKMHGAGNDYIYIDATVKPLHYDLAALARQISDRHFGVGGDGLVIILPSESADFRMRMFNADGSEAQMCGNASRCVGRLVYEKGLTDKDEITLETLAGIKILKLNFNETGDIKSVTVDMGEPVIRPDRIPVRCERYDESKAPLLSLHTGGIECTATAIGMGNPHGVIFDLPLDDETVLGHGPDFEKAECWPEKGNIEFVKIISPTEAEARVWERGSGETLACGTGACAILTAGVMRGLLERKAVIKLPGGELEIRWDERTNHIFLTGEAVTVAEGSYHLPPKRE